VHVHWTNLLFLLLRARFLSDFHLARGSREPIRVHTVMGPPHPTLVWRGFLVANGCCSQRGHHYRPPIPDWRVFVVGQRSADARVQERIHFFLANRIAHADQTEFRRSSRVSQRRSADARGCRSWDPSCRSTGTLQVRGDWSCPRGCRSSDPSGHITGTLKAGIFQA
jgi:hypothetical protein